MNELNVTIDTNLIIYLLDEDSEDNNFKLSSDLLRSILESKVLLDVKLTTSIESDLEQDKDFDRKKKIIKRAQNIFSYVGSVNVSDELFDEIKRILFPSLSDGDSRYENKKNDILHLAKHIVNKRNIFVTNDKNFVRKKNNLNNAFSIQIMAPEEFIEYVKSLNDIQSFKHKTHPIRSDYYSPELSGVVEFDFTNNDKKFTVGSGDFIFETRWSSRDSDSMYVYNDSTSIEKLAIVENETKFKNVKDEYNYDFTSRSREPRKEKDLIILKNTKGYYAVIKILDVKNKDRGDDVNLLKFEYLIETKGQCSFKKTK
jgi:predicted nucleic acid-binding protein